MAEREELIQRSNSREKQYKGYGALPSSGQDYDEDVGRPVKCICTRRDCVLVTVLSILIVASIITSLVIGIPSIQQKRAMKIAKMNPNSPSIDFQSPPEKTNIQKRAAIVPNDSLCNGMGLCAR